jgi:hypothetical protein
MVDTARNLSWRQGDILSDEAVAICDLVSADGSSEFIYAVVISHDCDLAASESKEPNAEVIMGKRVRKLGRDSFAKTARRLQIEYHSADGLIVLELSATEKIPVPKASLSTCAPAGISYWTSRDATFSKNGWQLVTGALHSQRHLKRVCDRHRCRAKRLFLIGLKASLRQGAITYVDCSLTLMKVKMWSELHRLIRTSSGSWSCTTACVMSQQRQRLQAMPLKNLNGCSPRHLSHRPGSGRAYA